MQQFSDVLLLCLFKFIAFHRKVMHIYAKHVRVLDLLTQPDLTQVVMKKNNKKLRRDDVINKFNSI